MITACAKFISRGMFVSLEKVKPISCSVGELIQLCSQLFQLDSFSLPVTRVTTSGFVFATPNALHSFVKPKENQSKLISEAAKNKSRKQLYSCQNVKLKNTSFHTFFQMKRRHFLVPRRIQSIEKIRSCSSFLIDVLNALILCRRKVG